PYTGSAWPRVVAMVAGAGGAVVGGAAVVLGAVPLPGRSRGPEARSLPPPPPEPATNATPPATRRTRTAAAIPARTRARRRRRARSAARPVRWPVGVGGLGDPGAGASIGCERTTRSGRTACGAPALGRATLRLVTLRLGGSVGRRLGGVGREQH